MMALTAAVESFDHPVGVYLMDENGSNVRRLTDERLGSCAAAHWSLDGERLLFPCHLDQTPTGPVNILTIHVQTGNLMCLTPDEQPRPDTRPFILQFTQKLIEWSQVMGTFKPADGSAQQRLEGLAS